MKVLLVFIAENLGQVVSNDTFDRSNNAFLFRNVSHETPSTLLLGLSGELRILFATIGRTPSRETIPIVADTNNGIRHDRGFAFFSNLIIVG